MNFVKRNIDIILILLLGFILRFSISITHSYSNDELSAINRLRYDNFSDLIEFGVMKGDMHPAGVQVFMKIWSLIGGTSEGWMRFPFVLCGVASIFMVFLMGLRWFKSRQVGLIAAALLATLYFPVLNSEFTRPYSAGLLIILLLAWFYHKVFFCEVKKYKNAIFLGVLFAAAMYTHYFAFMFAGFIGFTGLFFINKTNFRLYGLACLIGITLFIPHLSVTQYHLGVGGLQWLGAPDNNWILMFMYHSLNEDLLLVIILSLLAISALLSNKELPKFEKRYLVLCIVWFFGIYAVGHVFSIISTPVLKYPVMLFALPFFLLLIGLILSKVKFQKVLIPVILVACTSSTIVVKDLYGNQHYGIFKEIATDIVKWNKLYGKNNIYTVYNLSNPDYMNFYASQMGDTIDFDWDVIEYADDMNIRRDLEKRTEDYCIVGYSARLTLPQVFETVKEFYPLIVDTKKYNNSAVFLMTKGFATNQQEQEILANFDFHQPSKEWTYDENAITHVSNHSYYSLGDGLIYGPEFNFTKKEISNLKSKYIKVEVEAEIFNEGELTITLSGTRNGELIQYREDNFWMGHDVEGYMNEKGKGVGYFAFRIPEHIQDDDELKISLWNRNGKEINIYTYQIYLMENIWN